MAKSKRKRYSPKFKFQMVLEALRSPGTDAEVARAFEIHPITLSKWKKEFLEKGPENTSGRSPETLCQPRRFPAQLAPQLLALASG